MGMFDTVSFRCPSCGSHNEFQTKAGDCTLETYHINEIPVDIAKSLDKREIFCDNCNTKLELEWPKTAPKYVHMNVNINDWSYDD